MIWTVIKRILIVICTVSLALIACAVIVWSDADSNSKKYTYVGTQLVRVDNTTDQVQVYNQGTKKWEPMP
jgi:uncharacterized protein YxeA